MADAIISATVQVLLEQITWSASDRVGMLLASRKELERLRGSVAMIEAMLDDAEKKQGRDEAVQLWLKELEGVAFEAYNLIDDLHYEILRRRVEFRAQHSLQQKVCFSICSPLSITTSRSRWRMASKVRDMNKKLEKMNLKADYLGLCSRLQIKSPIPAAAINSGVKSGPEEDSVVVGPKMVGRANDESIIVEMLVSSSSSQKGLFVLPIVGTGGVGKTTLAMSVYNNPQIDGHFGRKVWVCVNHRFGVMELLKSILESLTGATVELSVRDSVVQLLREHLNSKNYLLVLDDVWETDHTWWDEFFTTLKSLTANHGSSCLVTTRAREVASAASRYPCYIVRQLSGDECWSILKEKAFAGGELPKEFHALRKQIVDKCQGLPLAAHLIGGMLRLKREEDRLSSVEHRLLNLDMCQGALEAALKLSFDSLPSPSIKKCFAYCSIFPSNTAIERDQLIQLWMAEGFLEPIPGEGRVMEEIGSLYCTILSKSSLFEEDRRRGKICYTMHDLVHDFAQSISSPKSINLDDEVIDIEHIDHRYPVRYLALRSSAKIPENILKDISSSVSTLLVKSGITDAMLSKFKYLHVLNLSSADIEELPSSIGRLKHLSYLSLSNCSVQTLPESLCKLYNLQTLRIDHGRFLKALPKGTSNLVSLRHLQYLNTDPNFQMPLEVGRLTSLRTLEFFNVGQDNGRQIEELGHLKNLRGGLVIRNLELVNGKEGAQRANLFGKPNLLKLEFVWGCRNGEGAGSDEDVLEGLQPHPNLQKLVIKDFMGDQFPEWFMNLSLGSNHLIKLSLSNCRRCRVLPALGQLSFLQNLRLNGLESIESIGLQFYGIDDFTGGLGSTSSLPRKFFPALETLSLENMANLVHWTEAGVNSTTGDTVDVFPRLKSLIIENCAQLKSIPICFPSLKLLKLVSCPNLTCISGWGSVLETLHLHDCGNMRELPEDPNAYQSLRVVSLAACRSILISEGQKSLMSLQALKIAHCIELASIPGELLECCTSLRELKVYDCPNLVSFPFQLQKLHSLSTVWLHQCPKLITMPQGFGFLTCLRDVSIGPFSDFSAEFDWSGLSSSSVLVLSLYGWPHLESLPLQLQHFTTLRRLDLFEFGLSTLPDWIGNLACLEELNIWHCEKLQYLPSVVAMRHLTNLTLLNARGCHLLKDRCTPPSGPEWSKISHIPHSSID